MCHPVTPLFWVIPPQVPCCRPSRSYGSQVQYAHVTDGDISRFTVLDHGGVVSQCHNSIKNEEPAESLLSVQEATKME